MRSPKWMIPVAVILQSAGLAVCIGALALGSAALAYVAAIYLFCVWLMEWVGWMAARRNLKEMPLLGCGAIVSSCSDVLPPATIIAASRNQERLSETSLRSMFGMDYPDLEIVLVDDHSTDATPQILDRLAREFAHLRVLHDPPSHPTLVKEPSQQCGTAALGCVTGKNTGSSSLPNTAEGGCATFFHKLPADKPNAYWYAAQHVSPDRAWLLFTNVDILFGPTVLRDAVLFAEREKLGFMTCFPHVEARSLLEDLLRSPIWSRLLASFQYGRLNNSDSQPLGISAFLLVRRNAYLAAGGHAAIMDDPSDAMALARLMKGSGAAVGVARAGDQLRSQEHFGFRELARDLVSRHRIACRDQYGSYASVALHTLVQSISPMPLALACIAVQTAAARFSFSLTLLATAALAVYIQGVRSFSAVRTIVAQRPASPFLHPVSGVFGLALNCIAVMHRAFGKNLD